MLTKPVFLTKVMFATLLIALSGVLYGFLGYLGTAIMQDNHMSISCMLFWRFFIAGLWMLIFVYKNHLTKNIAAVDNRVLAFMFLLSAAGYGGSTGFYFIASQSIGTGLAMVIFFSYPIAVAGLSWIIHRHKLAIETLFTLILMIIGLFLLRDTSGDAFSVNGLIFGILSAICYAAYMIGSKRYSSAAIDSNILTMVVCFGSAFIFLIISVADGKFVIPTSLMTWAYLLAFGTLITAVPIQLMLEGLKYVSATRASIISVLEPLVTLIVGMIFLHETVTYVQLAGGFLILGSAIVVQFQKV